MTASRLRRVARSSPGRGRWSGPIVLVIVMLAACGGEHTDTAVDAETVTAERTSPSTSLPTTTPPPPPRSTTTSPPRPTTTSAAPVLPPPSVTVPSPGPEPVAIASDAIGLLSPLQPVGLQADDGGIEVPDFALAGWYRLGGRPGSAGPTVFVGHVDSRDGPAVFYRLRDLGEGDTVDVVLADGATARYAVTGTEQFAKNEFPTFAVFGATEQDLIRLVTCTGQFDRDRRSYDDNLVVTAVRIEP